jgi:hypothetical protein
MELERGFVWWLSTFVEVITWFLWFLVKRGSWFKNTPLYILNREPRFLKNLKVRKLLYLLYIIYYIILLLLIKK